jgi:hypothetical protein
VVASGDSEERGEGVGEAAAAGRGVRVRPSHRLEETTRGELQLKVIFVCQKTFSHR